MSDDNPIPEQPSLPLSAGDQLREARTLKGLSIAQVAAETRIPERHLETIEAGRFADLPGRGYAIGFARTYAKLVGLDPEVTIAKVREELAEQAFDARQRPATFEPGDPARVPSSTLGWLSLLALVAAGVVFFFAYRTYFAPASELPSLLGDEPTEAASARPSAAPAAAASPAAPSGPVVFTAVESAVWVKFYDAAGQQLMQKEMALGESYTVPVDASGPLLWTGRPDALAITIGGRAVPKLAEVEGIVRDVPVTAAALLARPAVPPAASPSASASASPTG